jgi:pimeloyl-ACP methyl ester carboxylesterase
MPAFRGSDGAQLHYDDLHPAGSDTVPLIALAGGAGRHPDYLGDLAGLSTRQRLIVPHLRGVGHSPMPDAPERGSFWRQAEDIESLRVHLGLERALLLGHSAGTRLAIGYAAQFPDRVAGMVLVSPPSRYPGAGDLVDVPSDAEELIGKRRGEPAFDTAVEQWAAGPATLDDAGFNAWQQRVAPLGYAAWGAPEQAHTAIAPYSFAANRAFFGVEAPPDLAARLGAVTAPVLVIAGAQDCSVGVAPVIAMAGLFPAGTAVVIEGAGHNAWVEQPAAFRAAIEEFLSRADLFRAPEARERSR